MKKLFLFIVLLAGAGFTVQAQNVFYADNNQGSPVNNAQNNYSSLQAAIDAAAAGDIIYIQPSPNSYGDVNMTKPLAFYGLGHNPQLNNGARAVVNNIFFRSADASGSIISGLEISGIYLDNTTYNNHNVVITNNRINNIHGNPQTGKANDAFIAGNFFYEGGFNYIDNYNSQNWVFTHNTFTHEISIGSWALFYRLNNSTLLNNNIILSRQNGDTNQRITLFSDCSGVQISNNIFIFTGNAVIDFTTLGSNSALNFQNNLTYSTNTTLNALSGTNNIDDTNPLFVSFNPATALNNTANDYHFQTGSPAIVAGADGKDLGVENGNYPFSIRGYPTGLPYLTYFVINNNFLSAGTDLDIQVKASANSN
ncbi:MAG TPA: hypothetical protein VGA80_03720 [Flavobacteriaceae bacterium]